MLRTEVILQVLHPCMYDNMFVILYFCQRVSWIAMCNLSCIVYPCRPTICSGRSTSCAAWCSTVPKCCHAVDAAVWQALSYVCS